MPMADFRRAFDLDIFSLFQLTQLAAIEMEKAGGGAMLTATSIAGENKRTDFSMRDSKDNTVNPNTF